MNMLKFHKPLFQKRDGGYPGVLQDFNEGTCVSKDILETESLADYTVRVVLRQLGIITPTEKQIDIMESIVAMIGESAKIRPQTIRKCVGNADLAYCYLFLKNPALE